MHEGRLVFTQLMDFLPRSRFHTCVRRYRGNRRVQSFTCLDQFFCMAFAQLTSRRSLRDVELCLRAHRSKLFHMGIRGGIARNTLANANKVRNWQIYADLAQVLIGIARPLYADEDLGLDLDHAVYALDSSTIDLCLSVFPWARFRSTKSGVKLHTLLDLRGSIPTFLHISNANLHDVNALDLLAPEPGAFYVMDRGYVDFRRLFAMEGEKAFFVIRAKSNMRFQRRYSRPVDKTAGLLCDQTIQLTGRGTSAKYPHPLRRVKFRDAKTDRTFQFLTNNFKIPAITVADLYRSRWQVELFFRWIKQHLRIKVFLGTTENAVKTQIWIAVSVYVLVAIARKRLEVPHTLHAMLQVLSLTLFEREALRDVLLGPAPEPEGSGGPEQLPLFGT